jgi:dihydroflavonol-4-reductase
VDDVADGVILAYQRGEIGESYVLGGELGRMRDLIEKVAEIAGRKPPRFTMPTAALRALSPLGPVLGPALGFPPNFKELISTSDGVTYWARDTKARERLQYAPRNLEAGLRETLSAAAT